MGVHHNLPHEFLGDHFALFGLERRYALERAELERRYHELQAQVHPDKHSRNSEAERRLAMQWATRANEGYRVLRDPLARARYLLHLAGMEVERNGALAPEFLLQQLEWREAVEEARHAAAITELEHLHRRLSQEMHAAYVELAAGFAADPIDYPHIADRVRRLMFQEKLLSEIDDALASVEV